ncbi:MAG TPA: hypothetical protein VGP01_01295 [Rhizomicrobium sp.]|nr:hypothetical protein [Rhizomicrobium sp.]
MRFTLLALLSALSACESASDRALRNSPDYKAGYSDGCTSAGTQGANMRDTSPQRDEEAYRANPAYRTGWGTGFNTCRGYQSGNMPPLPGQGPIPDPNPHPF